MEKTKIVVIGLGGIAQLVHLPIVKDLENAEIVAVSEIEKNKLNTIGGNFSIGHKYLDYSKMLEEIEFDAAIIATPTDTHYQIALDCLGRGKHVLIEKPIARNYEETEEIHRLADKLDLRVMEGMNLRFRPDAMLLKSLIKTGELGELFYIQTNWMRKQSSDTNWFLQKSKSGGGVLFDLGISLIDLGLWIFEFPPVYSISTQLFHQKTENVEDSAVGFIRFKNSAVLNFAVSWSLNSEQKGFEFESFGTEGTANLNPFQVFKKLDVDHIDYSPSKKSKSKNLFKKSYENEVKHFIASIRENTRPYSTTDESLYRMSLIEGVYKSAQSQTEIRL